MSPQLGTFWSQGEIRRLAEYWVLNFRDWKDYGRQVSKEILVQFLVWAASIGASVTGVVKCARNAPSHESVRKALLANLPDLRTLTGELSSGLQGALPQVFRKKPFPVAIDMHQRPYYGDHHQTPGVRGGKAKASSSWFWTYASVAILSRGRRWVVALVPVSRTDTLVDVLEALWEQMRRFPVRISRILLDKEFCNADVIRWLQARHVPYIMPLVRRGKVGVTPELDTGNQRFFRRGMRGFFDYSWRKRHAKASEPAVHVRVACVPHPDSSRKRPTVFVVSHSPGWSLKWIGDVYRSRFGIETSYRQLGEALAKTTTKNPSWRLLLVGIALMLRNLWVCCVNAALRPREIMFGLILQWINTVSAALHPRIAAFAARHPPPKPLLA